MIKEVPVEGTRIKIKFPDTHLIHGNKIRWFVKGLVIDFSQRTTKTFLDQGENAAGRSTYSQAGVTVYYDLLTSYAFREKQFHC